nr:minichromosome maintenance protein MCM [uncultured archaeon]
MKTEDLLTEAKQFFEYYKKDIGKSIKKGTKSIEISFQEIASFSHELSDHILLSPEDLLQVLELALDEMGIATNARVRLTELPSTQKVMVRNIRAKHLNQLITVEGIIRQASDVRPQVINAKFECPSCGTIISVLQIDKKFTEPSRCSCGRRGNFRLVSKDMVDAQRIVIEESPESLFGGEQPRRMAIFLKEDLVDPKMEERTTPGSRILVNGVLKEVPVPLQTGSISTKFDLAIEANNLIPLEETFEELAVDEEEEREIKELAADPRIFEKLAGAIAPSVYGYDEIKHALVLQLFGGVKKTRSDGTSARGDIHILLVGDPGVAKSVILKFISSIAPKGRYVAGRAATGAGLTATVVRDEFLKGWALEAGAMVLSNRGVVCIDELEKMAPEDRTAMHEAMEQQTVTISKANVQAMLRAETSVLGAANPQFGRFDPYKPIAQQIDLPPTLINRFDVMFIMRDLPERVKDEAIASHVLQEHKREATRQYIEPELFRKYIAYAKQHVKPELTDKAVEEIKKFYVELRNAPTTSDQVIRPVPITARQLDALIRLSEANARARLSSKVKEEDAKKAIELLKYYLMHVGFDYETKQIDIDRIATGVPASKRSKIVVVREAVTRLESRIGQLIPIEELKKELEDKIDSDSVDEAVDELNRVGDVFIPRKGFIQRVK